MNPACPHCGVVLDPPPKSNRKCPDCRDPIVVRTRDGNKLLFTPAGADEYDRERKEEYARNAARRKAQAIGATDADWDQAEAELTERFGQTPSGGDVFWSLANKTVVEAGQRGEWHRAGMTYFQMGLHLKDEGREFHGLRQEAMRCFVRNELQSAAQFGYQQPVLRLNGQQDERELCAADDGREFTAEQLLVDDPPVPHHYDDGRWCPCSVRFDLQATEQRFGPPQQFAAEIPPPPAAEPPQPERRGILRRLTGR